MLLVTAAMGSACSGDDGGDDLSFDASDGGTAADRPGADRAGTDPPGTEPTAVSPYVGELLLAYDRTVDAIVADPGVAEDPDDPLIQEFLGLFEEDSDVAAELVEAWVERADEGLRTEPYSDDYPATESTLDGELQTVSEDEVTFPICVISRARVVDADEDEVGTSLPRLDHPGEGTAVRTDEGWRLRELAIQTDQLTCTGGDG